MDKRNCGDCQYYDGTLFEALSDVVWYNGNYEWLKGLRDELLSLPEGEVYYMPHDIQWHTEKHTIMMLLVGMFGEWGTSIRAGWIGDKDGCIEFIEKLCHDCWDEE